MKDSYDIVGEAVKAFWENTGFAEEVIVFFYQKYEWEDRWEWCEELVTCESPNPDESAVVFENDFCEGETCVKNLTIVPLRQVTEYYAEQHRLREVNND